MLEPCSVIKKKLQHRWVSVNFAKFLETLIEHLPTAASDDGRSACTDLTLQVMMASSQLGHVTNVCGCISTSKYLTTKLRMINSMLWYYLADLITSSNLKFVSNILPMTVDHMTNAYGFISTAISLRTTKLGKMVNQSMSWS